MRNLIPKEILEKYTVIFIPVPDIEEYHTTKLNFTRLPEIHFLNEKMRPDFIKPLLFTGKNTSLILMDKPGNHDFFALMLLHGGRFPKRGFPELSCFEIKKMFEIYGKFIEFWQEQPDKENYTPRFSFNHDPYTTDRPGLQSIERFHAHFYFFQNQTLDVYSRDNGFLLKNILHKSSYKDYFDPGSVPLEKVLLDLHRNCIKVPKHFVLVEESLLDKVENRRGLGFNILYNGNTHYFSQSAFTNYLVEVHVRMEKLFSDFMKCSLIDTQGEKIIDKGKASQYIENIPWLSSTTKLQLLDLVDNLKNVSEKTYTYLSNRRSGKYILAYKSFCSSFSIDLRDKDPTKFLLNFCPRVFSEIGGAGLFSLAGYNAVIIDRKKDIFLSDEGIIKRRELQQNFMKRVMLLE